VRCSPGALGGALTYHHPAGWPPNRPPFPQSPAGLTHQPSLATHFPFISSAFS